MIFRRAQPFCLLALALGACSKTSSAPDASLPSAPVASATASASAEPASGAAVSGPAVSAGDLAWLPKPDFGARGPIKVKGFSRRVSTGMNDPAESVGYTKDGHYFGYCASIGARDEHDTSCEFVDRSGKTTTLMAELDAKGSPAAIKKVLDTWLKEQGVPRIVKSDDFMWLAPPLTGDWDFASEIELAVDEQAQGKKGAMIRLGGSVRGEAPVYSIPIDHTSFNPQVPFHTAWVNGLALAPDGREIGIVGGFFCMEWCDAFEVRRIPTARLAAMVFNDTGMRHHEKKDFAGSAALFTKAVHADPTFPIAAYNLACALARTNDPKTKDALQFALRTGGDGVKARAKSDADFAAVRGEAFFKDLVER